MMENSGIGWSKITKIHTLNQYLHSNPKEAKKYSKKNSSPPILASYTSKSTEKERKDFLEALNYHMEEQIPCKVLIGSEKNSIFGPDFSNLGKSSRNKMDRKLLKMLNVSSREELKKKEVEVMISDSDFFSNSTLFSKMMSLEKFLEYDGIMTLFMAQYPIYTKLTPEMFYFKKSSPSGKNFKQKLRKINRENFKKLVENTPIPSFLGENIFLRSKISRVNVWASKSVTKSKLHYDFYENFLTVLSGRKTVYLWPPEDKIVDQKCKSNVLTTHEGEIDFTKLKLANRSEFELKETILEIK